MRKWVAGGPSDMRSKIRGYLAESPYLALHPSAQPSRAIEIAGRLAAKVLPKKQMCVVLVSNFPLGRNLDSWKIMGVHVLMTSFKAQYTLSNG